VSIVNEDLPEPDTPVTTINLLRGKSTEIFFRLCTLAPFISMEFRVERVPDTVAGFLTFVVIDMIGKTNILEVKQLDCSFP
jgi:hypothetical protein